MLFPMGKIQRCFHVGYTFGERARPRTDVLWECRRTGPLLFSGSIRLASCMIRIRNAHHVCERSTCRCGLRCIMYVYGRAGARTYDLERSVCVSRQVHASCSSGNAYNVQETRLPRTASRAPYGGSSALCVIFAVAVRRLRLAGRATFTATRVRLKSGMWTATPMRRAACRAVSSTESSVSGWARP